MKVGDYIHYHASNYLKYGLTVDKQQNTIDPVKVLQDQKNTILKHTLTHYNKKQKNNIKNTLEEQLNFYFNPSDNNKIKTGYSAEEQAEIVKLMQDICEQAAKSIKPEAFSDQTAPNMSSLHAIGSANNVDVSSMPGVFSAHRDNATLGAEGKTKTTTKAVRDRINDLITLRTRLMGRYLSTNTPSGRIIDDINALEKQYNELLKSDDILNDTLHNRTYYYTDKNIGFLKELQRVIDETKQDTASQAKGILGEVVPAFSQMVAQYVANDGTNSLLEFLREGLETGHFVDVLKDKVVGSKESVKILRSDKVMDKKNKTSTSLLGVVQTQIRDTPLSVKATADKVDVVLDLPGEETINASVKNVNLYSGSNISLLDGGKKGQNMLNMIQDYPIFANHYFNLMANAGRHDPFTGSILQQAHEVMKLTIALKAFAGGLQAADASGNTFKTQQAELFIVNHSSASTKTGHYKVFFISDIINQICNELDKWITIQGLPDNYANNWIDSDISGLYKCRRCEGPSMKHALARSSKILEQAKMNALTVTLNTAQMRNLYFGK